MHSVSAICHAILSAAATGGKRHVTRRLAVAMLLLAVLATGCETKSPVGPVALPTTTSTTTTTVPVTPVPTTSTTTTTTIVLGSLARRYVAFQPPPNTPSETTLFFELLTGGAGGVLAGAIPFGGPATEQVIENRYRVTGVYVMPNGTTGNITGVLGGSSNPLETGGEFTGTFTAQTPTGCTAQRPFAGRINPQTLQMSGTEPGTATCSPSPLDIPPITMLRSDPGAPLPTTTSSTSTSTTSTSTVPCTYSLSPGSLTVDSAGGPRQVSLSAPFGCSWALHSFADWIVFTTPTPGTGSGQVSFTVAPNTTGATRTGNLLIAGQQVTVTQQALLLADLVAHDMICAPDSPSDTVWSVSVRISNVGPGDAGASETLFDFAGIAVELRDTIPLPSGSSTTHQVPIPSWLSGDPFDGFVEERRTIMVVADFRNQVAEADDLNNNRISETCVRCRSIDTGLSRSGFCR